MNDVKTSVRTIATKLQPLLEKMGPPREVLPACLYVMAVHAKSHGRSAEQFVASMLPFIAAVWDLDPVELAYAIADAAHQHGGSSS